MTLRVTRALWQERVFHRINAMTDKRGEAPLRCVTRPRACCRGLDHQPAPAPAQDRQRVRAIDGAGLHSCLLGVFKRWRTGRMAADRGHLPADARHVPCQQQRAAARVVAGRIGCDLDADFVVSDLIATGRLVELLPQHRPAAQGVYGIVAHQRHVSRKVAAFLDFVASQMPHAHDSAGKAHEGAVTIDRARAHRRSSSPTSTRASNSLR